MATQAHPFPEKTGISLDAYFEYESRCYKKIPGLQQIIFVSQKEQHIRILEHEVGRWIDMEFYEDGDVLKIGKCELSLPEVYRRVSFSSERATE